MSIWNEGCGFVRPVETLWLIIRTHGIPNRLWQRREGREGKDSRCDLGGMVAQQRRHQRNPSISKLRHFFFKMHLYFYNKFPLHKIKFNFSLLPTMRVGLPQWKRKPEYKSSHIESWVGSLGTFNLSPNIKIWLCSLMFIYVLIIPLLHMVCKIILNRHSVYWTFLITLKR